VTARLVRSGVLIGLLASAAPLSAQARLSSGVDTTLVTVGDRIELEVTVEHPSDAVVVWPDSLDLGPFELLGARVEPMRTEGTVATSGATFALAAFELGELELPSIEVTVMYGDGSEERLATDRYGIEVASVGVEEGADIREIRGPLAIPVGALWVLLWALALMLLAGAGWAVLRRIRARSASGEARPAGSPPRPAHELALEALDALERSDLLESGRVKEYHIRVSDVLRRYVEARFGVAALEHTTWEVLEGLATAGIDEGFRDGLRRFLEPCDMVKFAKARPGVEASRRVLTLGRELVESSAPAAGEGVGGAGGDHQSVGSGEDEPVATARQGESTARQGESTARQGESTARKGESTARKGESTVRQGESTSAARGAPRPDGPPQRGAAPAAPEGGL